MEIIGEITSILIFIIIIVVIIYCIVFYFVDLLLKKSFKPNEEYLLEINNFKCSTIKGVFEPIVIFIPVFTKSKVIKISSIGIVIVFELIYFLSKLKYLKSKEESINTIKYLIFKAIFDVFSVILPVLYFYCEIVS